MMAAPITSLRWPHALLLALALAGTGAGLAVAAADRSPGPRYTPAYEFTDGTEWVMVFLVSSGCNAHRTEGFTFAIDRAKLALQARAQEQGRAFRSIGASIDWRPKEAGRFLERFGEFDEMALGGNWLNTAVVRYVWRDIPGSPSVPQIIVVERSIELAGDAIDVSNERVLHRIVGSEEIIAWIDDGAPFEQDERSRTERDAPDAPHSEGTL